MGLIAGIYSKQNGIMSHEKKLADMVSCQKHRCRGDSSVLYICDRIAIAMVNHLNSVFSLEDAPINYDKFGHYGGIFAFTDGIVLNVPEHKRAFEKDGIPVQDDTCTSIVAAAYQKWGLDFMVHLEGEFSCAIWDKKLQRLLLVRDPYGHKPLHYFNGKNEFYFSSEIKGILKAGIKPEIDMTSLSDFLSLNCIPYPSTIFKHIFQVPPGSMVSIENNKIEVKNYWHPTIKEDRSISFDNAVIQANQLIKEAVKKRAVGKDKSFCFLSGGMDSSALVSFLAEISSGPVEAICVGFEDDESNELEDAETMANHVGVKLHQVIANPESFFDMLNTLVYHHDSPFTDTSAYPSYYAGKLGAGLTDVILTGDGPDQSMGGSGHYVFALKNQIFSKRNLLRKTLSRLGSVQASLICADPTPGLVSRINRKLYRDSLSPVHAAYDVRSYFPDIVKKYVCTRDLWNIHLDRNPYRHPESWFLSANGADNINKYLYADMKFYVPDNLMIKVDRMCMAHGLETLSPFQDIKLAELINKLPGTFKIFQEENKQFRTKYILNKVCEKRFPDQILNKKKKGFSIPLDKWLRQDAGEKIKEILLDPITLRRGFFKPESIKKMIDIFLQDKGDYFFPSPNSITALLTFELWHRNYIDGINF
ncbi:asparagine synthase (glutamine-hydrolyzing) [Desulfatiferula olefinivorans]